MTYSDDKEPSDLTQKKRRWLGFAIITACILAAVLCYPLIDDINLRDLEEVIQASGAWAAFASIGLMILHSFVPFPAELLAIANGMLFGSFLGIFVTWVGAMLGASIAFALARWLGRPFVQKVADQGKLQKADEWLEKSGWQVLLIARLLPFIAFNLINYAAGLSRIGWWTFLWTTSIGILPLTILMVLMGDHVDLMIDYWHFLLVAAIFIGLVLGTRWYYRRRLATAIVVRQPPS